MSFTVPAWVRKMFVGFREIAAGPYDESVSPIRPLKPEMLFRLTETAAAVPGESVREVVLSDNSKCGPVTLTGTLMDC